MKRPSDSLLDEMSRATQSDIANNIVYKIVAMEARRLIRKSQRDNNDLPEWVINYMANRI